MKTLLNRYAVLAFALSSGTLLFAADRNVNQALTGDTDWNDLSWTEGDPATASTAPSASQSAEVKVSNTDYDITVAGGKNHSVGSVKFGDKANIVVGDTSGTAASFTSNGTLELSDSSTMVIKSNGTLNISGSNKMQFYSYSHSDPDKLALLVDGGVVNGNIQVGSTSGSAIGVTNILFKNGATLNRNTEVNPLKMQGRSNLTFDASTYNVFNADQNGVGSGGFGNHSFNIDPTGGSGYDTQTSVVFDNGSVLNGAGIISGSTIADYDFSSPIYNVAGISAVDLTLQVKSLTNATDYFSFSILGGSKVSAKKLKFGTSDDGLGSTGGTLSFIMEGDSSSAKSMYAGTEGTEINLSDTRNADGAYSNATWEFFLNGNTSYDTNGDFSIARDKIRGGKLDFAITGDDNYFRTNTLKVNGGSGGSDGVKSNAQIQMNFGDGATNSVFSHSNIELVAGADSDIHVKYSGVNNSIEQRNGHTYITNSTDLTGKSTTRLEYTDGISYTSTNQLRFYNKASGLSEVIVANGATVTHGNLRFDATTSAAGGTAESYLVIDGGSFTSTNDINYYAKGSQSGTVGIKMTGDSGYFRLDTSMNPDTDATTVGGMFIVDIGGSNNEFSIQNNLHMRGVVGSDNAGYKFEMTGYGNTAKIGTFNLGNDEQSTAGTYSFRSQGTVGMAKNNFLTNALTFHGSTVGASTATTKFVLAGNTILRHTDGTGGIHLKVMEDAGKIYQGGKVVFEISGAGNDALFTNFQVGNNQSTGGEAVFRVQGGGSIIHSTGNFQIRRGDVATNWDNVYGGVFEAAVDDTGFSKIVVDTNNLDLTGLFHLDFSLLTADDVDATFVILSVKTSASDLQSRLSNWITDFDADTWSELVKVTVRDATDSIDFIIEQDAVNSEYYNFIVQYVSSIPEPGTYAAIFGALALAFAAYRKRKS